MGVLSFKQKFEESRMAGSFRRLDLLLLCVGDDMCQTFYHLVLALSVDGS